MHIGDGRSHYEHTLVADRLLFDPGNGPTSIADLEPAFDIDDDFDGIISPEHEQRLSLKRRRIVHDDGGLGRRMEFRAMARARTTQ